jgi:Putative rhamnosyl transferase
MNFSHFLITQFNLKQSPKSKQGLNDDWIEWTKNRIELFKGYCLPSIVNQTNKEFTWLIFFDSDTPHQFQSFLNELEEYAFIKICYANGMEDFHLTYMREVETRLKLTDKWIITTRLDNDDMLHQEAIKIIQDNFTGRNGFMISLASGYVLDISEKVLAHYYYPMSPFISIVESVSDSSRGIFLKLHTQWPNLRLFIFREIYIEKFKPSERLARFVLSQPMWIQTFHGKNVSNSFYRGLPVLNDKVLSDFGVNVSTGGMKLKELPRFANYVIWKRYLKSWIVKIVLKK